MADPAGPAFDIERAGVLRPVPHGFFGSAGGEHQFGFGGPGEEGAVRTLRAAAAQAIAANSTLLAPHQVHSPDVVAVGDAWPDEAEGRPVADALVTDRPGMALAIVTADCAPVLFADHKAGVIGAAHAGWRGAHGGVLENTLAAMVDMGGRLDRIAAAIGPTIARPSYEVDAAFRENFEPRDDIHFFDAPERDGKARWHFDLPGYILARLSRAGVARAEDLGLDTYSRPQRYHSYRRASQAGKANYGRQISIVALP